MNRVRTGLEVFSEQGFVSLRGLSLGVLCNQAAVDSNLTHLISLLEKTPDVRLKRIFAPEHGLFGELQNMEYVANTTEPLSGVEVFSLYSSQKDSLSPSSKLLEDLDVILVDLPDIGSRCYTFAQSLVYAMQVAKQTNTRVVLLDRPNPLGGLLVEGARLCPQCRSFCGYAPVTNRHGLTLGELALGANSGFRVGADNTPGISCQLEIIKAEDWTRSEYYDQTGLPWVLPSPNIPTLNTALVYPGMCLFEATNVSEGRGTTRPFELVGAPYIDANSWALECRRLDAGGLDGATLRPLRFRPKFDKYQNETCDGLQIHVTERSSFRPFRLALTLLTALNKLYPNDFSFRSQNSGITPAIDLLYGSSAFREFLDLDLPLSTLFQSLDTFEHQYITARAELLLYH